MVAPMEVGRADGPFLLHVRDFTVRVDVLIAADDAAAIECGEAEETNDAHTASPRSRLADDPDGQGGGPGTMTLNRCLPSKQVSIPSTEQLNDDQSVDACWASDTTGQRVTGRKTLRTVCRANRQIEPRSEKSDSRPMSMNRRGCKKSSERRQEVSPW